MTHVIDEKTGLPVPPIPGTYWEVREFNGGEVFPATPDKEESLVDFELAGYYVLLCMEEWTEASRVIKRNPKARFWNSEPKEITEHIPPKRIEQVLYRRWCGSLDWTLEEWRIREAAKDICERVGMERKRAEAAQRLVGKYPPNKIG